MKDAKETKPHCNTSKAAITVIHYLGCFCLLSFMGGVTLLILARNVSEVLVTTMIVGPVGTALGGLVGLLGNTREHAGTPDNPISTVVTNPKDDPVPVETP